jgi:hypothetical protein
VADKSDDIERESEENLEGPNYWLAAPATYCDYFLVDAWGGPRIVRMAFGEVAETGRRPLFRVGIAMPIDVAKELADILREVIQRAERAADTPAAPARPASKT